jgi:ABC-type phosphate/phosphonate transport system ATPase subunit
MSEILIQNVSKTYSTKDGNVQALKNVNLSIEQGDIYGIIGMSGAGKSTLVRCINYLEEPTEGKIFIKGKELGSFSKKELRKQREDIGMIFQHFNLLMQKSVLENICFPLYIHGKKKTEARKRAKELLEIVGGALQDLDRAVVLGSRSFGKGLVQRSIDMSFGTQVKVTISRYYTPSGRCIQALDYTRKDKNGVATRTEEKNYNAFKTRKGRTVYDGGGIQPDIELAETQVSAVANAVLRNEAIFDYATTYFYKNPNLGNTIPTFPYHR